MDSNELKEQIELLIDLQQKEAAAARIQAEIWQIPEQIEEMASLLTRIEEQLQVQKSAFEELKKIYRAHETEIQTHQSRIEKREAQLHSVKTNQEYRAFLKEISDIKSATSAIEDKMLQCLDDMEAAEKSIANLNGEFEREKQSIAEQRRELSAHAENLRQEQEKLIAERDEIAVHIKADMMKKYRFVRGQTGGSAIVGARDAICMGCNMNIPPQLYNELHRGDELKFCPHCHRMLYVI